jgi:putative nucleotidyltransferase with HDIG domain
MRDWLGAGGLTRLFADGTTRVWLFVTVVAACGIGAIGYAILSLPHAPLNYWALVLAVLTLITSKFVISVPGQPATVSVSEVFVFASVLLFGPGPAILTVAADGLWLSLQHRNRRIYRILFNVAEPAVSTFIAGTAFFAVAGVAPFAQGGASHPSLLLPSAAMSMAYFFLNTLLQAAAVAVETRTPLIALWRQHSWYVAINCYAAGSLAALAVRSGVGLDLEVVGLIGPLLLLSYGAYKSAASRVDDAHHHVREIERLYQATVETLAIAVDAKDQVTHGHIRRVQRHTVALARVLGITGRVELKALEAASLLHDIGKLAVPDYVLNKPGALTPGEFEQMKLHATTGATILSTVEFPYPVVPIVRHHHEQWCGKGYPDGIAGEHIPIGARILTVVDCFDALTSDRPYRRKMSDEDAKQILLDRRGTMYDPAVVDAFIELIPVLREEDRAIDAEHPPSPEMVLRSSEGNAVPALAMSDQQGIAGIIRDTLPSVRPDAEACFFAIERGDLLQATSWTPRLEPIVRDVSIAHGEGLVGWVAAHRHTIINSHADLDLNEAAAALQLGACTAVPVFAFGTLIGVLAVYLPAGTKFSDEDVRRIGVLAQGIGMALLPMEESRVFIRRRSAA